MPNTIDLLSYHREDMVDSQPQKVGGSAGKFDALAA